ncbi:ADP-ribosylation factor-like protein 4D [Varanus komodoensis]|nr:ADP-ribosylation factor-like protein 4D [Varanus komodoensis]
MATRSQRRALIGSGISDVTEQAFRFPAAASSAELGVTGCTARMIFRSKRRVPPPPPPVWNPDGVLHVVVVGLDAAGKTSLLYRLKFQEFIKSAPTKGFNMEKIRVPLGGSRAITFQVWDVGGQEKLRPLWKSYMRHTDGVVFVVDSAEAERLEEARVELHRIARSSDNQGVPVLVLANKQDVSQALSVAELEKLLSLHELCTSDLSYIQGCSAVSGLGLQQGLEKLYEMILKRKKLLRSSRRKR